MHQCFGSELFTLSTPDLVNQANEMVRVDLGVCENLPRAASKGLPDEACPWKTSPDTLVHCLIPSLTML